MVFSACTNRQAGLSEYHEALALMEQGDAPSALERLEQAAELAQTDSLRALVQSQMGTLYFQQHLLEEAELSLMKLADATRSLNIISIVGLPLSHGGALYNCAAVIFKGKILGIVPKSYLPNYKEFYEMRWFASGLQVANTTIGYAGQTVPFGRRLLFLCILSLALLILSRFWSSSRIPEIQIVHIVVMHSVISCDFPGFAGHFFVR